MTRYSKCIAQKALNRFLKDEASGRIVPFLPLLTPEEKGTDRQDMEEEVL